MNARASMGLVAGAALAALLAWNSVYVVGEGREAVLTRLGTPIAIVSPPGAASPGLYLKWPLVENAQRFDDRLQSLAVSPRAVRTADAGRFEARALVQYRIVDPLAVMRAGGAQAVRWRLDAIAGDALASALKATPSADLLAGRTSPARLEDAVAILQRAASVQRLGVRIAGLSLQGASLDEADVEGAGVAEQAALARAAVQVQAQSEADRQAAIGAADREAADIRGAGEAAALRARGQGDAARAQILGAAYAKDPAFAAYLGRLDAYDGALNPADTTLVLSPSANAFLSTFGQGPKPVGAAAAKAR